MFKMFKRDSAEVKVNKKLWKVIHVVAVAEWSAPDQMRAFISSLSERIQDGEVVMGRAEPDWEDGEQQGTQLWVERKTLDMTITDAKYLRTKLQAALDRVQKPATTDPPDAKVIAGAPVDFADRDVPVIADPMPIADPMQDNPVLMLGIVGIILHLIIHFAVAMMYVFGDDNEEEESLLSDASIERHRRLFELQAQREREQHRNGNTVVLDTLNQILRENRHHTLTARIKELHARLIENGTLPKRKGKSKRRYKPKRRGKPKRRYKPRHID